ncbi:hypothetical protein LTR37_003154 [Vermiconidia calcicola]|uniref:Uncharacterized protein n=1 Tax=Vermiconidia calcicola TaxID=1690605 RepID=A0ACC3NQT7_9PEZI|nr:hypothetical protein LTR37_003154 [Vermiconidia calcicola]
MAFVYGNAFLTLTAAYAADSGEGCLQLPEPYAKPVSVQGVFVRAIHDHFRLLTAAFVNEFSAMPIEKRGWIFQQRILSRRVLYFERNKLVWKCPSSIECEASTGIGEGPDRGWLKGAQQEILWTPDQTLESLLTHWGFIVSNMTDKRSTFHKDRLPALAGVAQQMQPLLGSEYYAGHWAVNFQESLCWFVQAQPIGGLRPSPLDHQRVYTWCWAAAHHGAITFWPSVKKRFGFLPDSDSRGQLQSC